MRPLLLIPRITAQVSNAKIGERDQPLEVFLHCRMPAGEFVLERSKSQAEADVGLDHPVMEVTGDALAFHIGGGGGEPVHEADVFNRRHGVLEHLQEEGHVRGIKGPPSRRREIQPPKRLATIA